MLIRMRFLRACQVFLLCGLLLAAGQVIRAQSVGTAPSPVPVASPTQPPQSASPQTPPKPVLNFTEVVLLAEKQGGSTSIRNYIAEDLGLKPTSVDSPPVHARGLEYSDQRKLYVIDETGALLFMISNGDNTDVYLASHAGVLQSAGYFYPGRFHSQGFKRVSKEKAAAGFVAEKEFWIKKISDPKYGGAVKLEEPVRKTDYARPEASAKAKQEAKLEKKEGANEKKLADKAAAQKAKDDKRAEKNPKVAPANSNQQSNNDGDAAPPKKKISWF